MTRLLILVATALVAVVMSVAPAARADGDPASDWLYGANVYVPYGMKISPALKTQLQAYVTQARRKHYPIKVALIGVPYDLGAIPELFGKPHAYAKFLGVELSFVYHGTLLIVMPQGFGVYDNGRSVATQQRLLRRIPVQPGPDGLATSAVVAIRALAAAHGTRLTAVILTKPSGHSTTTRDRILIAVGALLGLLVLLLATRLAARHRRPA